VDACSTRPVVVGVHHLKFPVSDLDRSLSWYETVLNATRLREHDHFDLEGRLFAYILDVPGLTQHRSVLELTLAPQRAANMAGFDPVVFAVETMADLEQWARFLNSKSIANSGVLRGRLGWVLVTTDPDGLSVRFYCYEEHEPDVQKSDLRSPWFQYPGERQPDSEPIAAPALAPRRAGPEPDD
jgi:catechol 2,3-dioxygenase-like lactoylglutathione lyase family enzyme